MDARTMGGGYGRWPRFHTHARLPPQNSRGNGRETVRRGGRSASSVLVVTNLISMFKGIGDVGHSPRSIGMWSCNMPGQSLSTIYSIILSILGHCYPYIELLGEHMPRAVP
jgi:hypothetical protein